MIRVLIVDDSPVAQQFLVHILTSDPELAVAGLANNGREALEAVKYLRPDVITMDIHMRQVNGYQATRAIMESFPTPIVIVSSSASATDSAGMFQALEAGALAVVLCPPGVADRAYPAAAQELIRTVKLMAGITVVKRAERAAPAGVTAPLCPPAHTPDRAVRLIAIGASIGGPPVLRTILSGLPPDLPVPVLIVQHIAPGFVDGFVEWLAGATKFPVHVARHGHRPEPGHAYVAPDHSHLGLASGSRLVLSDQAAEYGSRPAVGFLLRTVAEVLGPYAIGVLLTGMGRDGADALKQLHDTGAATIAQDEASSVVHGMPGEAIRLGGASYVLPPEGIAATLVSLTQARIATR